MSDYQFQQTMLMLHNEYRAKHNAGPLFLDEEMCKYAKEWSQVNYNIMSINSQIKIPINYSI